jgi:hypothetical protein
MAISEWVSNFIYNANIATGRLPVCLTEERVGVDMLEYCGNQVLAEGWTPIGSALAHVAAAHGGVRLDGVTRGYVACFLQTQAAAGNLKVTIVGGDVAEFLVPDRGMYCMRELLKEGVAQVNVGLTPTYCVPR